LKDGRSVTSPRTEASGGHDRPLSPEVIREKYRSLAHPVLGEKLAGTIEGMIATMQIGATPSPLLDILLSRPPLERGCTSSEPSPPNVTTAKACKE